MERRGGGGDEEQGRTSPTLIRIQYRDKSLGGHRRAVSIPSLPRIPAPSDHEYTSSPSLSTELRVGSWNARAAATTAATAATAKHHHTHVDSSAHQHGSPGRHKSASPPPPAPPLLSSLSTTSLQHPPSSSSPPAPRASALPRQDISFLEIPPWTRADLDGAEPHSASFRTLKSNSCSALLDSKRANAPTRLHLPALASNVRLRDPFDADRRREHTGVFEYLEMRVPWPRFSQSQVLASKDGARRTRRSLESLRMSSSLNEDTSMPMDGLHVSAMHGQVQRRGSRGSAHAAISKHASIPDIPSTGGGQYPSSPGSGRRGFGVAGVGVGGGAVGASGVAEEAAGLLAVDMPVSRSDSRHAPASRPITAGLEQGGAGLATLTLLHSRAQAGEKDWHSSHSRWVDEAVATVAQPHRSKSPVDKSHEPAFGLGLNLDAIALRPVAPPLLRRARRRLTKIFRSVAPSGGGGGADTKAPDDSLQFCNFVHSIALHVRDWLKMRAAKKKAPKPNLVHRGTSVAEACGDCTCLRVGGGFVVAGFAAPGTEKCRGCGRTIDLDLGGDHLKALMQLDESAEALDDGMEDDEGDAGEGMPEVVGEETKESDVEVVEEAPSPVPSPVAAAVEEEEEQLSDNPPSPIVQHSPVTSPSPVLSPPSSTPPKAATHPIVTPDPLPSPKRPVIPPISIPVVPPPCAPSLPPPPPPPPPPAPADPAPSPPPPAHDPEPAPPELLSPRPESRPSGPSMARRGSVTIDLNSSMKSRPPSRPTTRTGTRPESRQDDRRMSVEGQPVPTRAASAVRPQPPPEKEAPPPKEKVEPLPVLAQLPVVVAESDDAFVQKLVKKLEQPAPEPVQESLSVPVRDPEDKRDSPTPSARRRKKMAQRLLMPDTDVMGPERIEERLEDILELDSDCDLIPVDPLDYLARFCVVSPEAQRFYGRVFDAVTRTRDRNAKLDVTMMLRGLRQANPKISDQELHFLLSVLDLFKFQGAPDGKGKTAFRDVDFNLFTVIAALSERVVALDPWVRRCVAAMDIIKLHNKVARARALFLFNDPQRTGRIPLDVLGLELKAGGVSAEHEENVMARLRRDGIDEFKFIDFLAHVPLFVMIHEVITQNPFDENCTR